MLGRTRRQPIRPAAISLQMLALFYLASGGMVFLVDWLDAPSLVALPYASKWLLPGAAFLLPAACIKPGKQWPLVAGLACTAVATVGLLALLGWGLWYVGPWRLAAWREPLASQLVLLVALLVALQSCAIYHLIAAWRVVAKAVGSGFDVGVPMPVRVIDGDGAADAAAEPVPD